MFEDEIMIDIYFIFRVNSEGGFWSPRQPQWAQGGPQSWLHPGTPALHGCYPLVNGYEIPREVFAVLMIKSEVEYREVVAS